MESKSQQEKIAAILIVLLLTAFLGSGLMLFKDYGASTDEINQIEAGHITWKALCKATRTAVK